LNDARRRRSKQRQRRRKRQGLTRRPRQGGILSFACSPLSRVLRVVFVAKFFKNFPLRKLETSDHFKPLRRRRRRRRTRAQLSRWYVSFLRSTLRTRSPFQTLSGSFWGECYTLCVNVIKTYLI
jgi:hypothetical protein